MMQLVFKGVVLTPPVMVGPAPSFRLEGTILRRGDTGQSVAEHRNWGWQILGQHFTRFDCVGRSVIEFRGEAAGRLPPQMPAERVRATDGVLYADDEPIAKFDESSGHWRDFETSMAWATVVLTPAT